MEPDHYEPERAEEILRRRLIVIGGGVMAPMFVWFSVIEYTFERMDMFYMNRTILRWSIA